MAEDSFSQRKNDILSKTDKSSKQSWDKRILSLCNKINSFKDYYTTSSCSGRIAIMIDQEKKSPDLFLKVYHDLIDFEKFKEDLNQIADLKKAIIKFKQEPCILHLVCRTLEQAQDFYDKSRKAGWRKHGIISSKKRFIVEINGTGIIEFPIINKGKILVNDEFLKLIVDLSNKKLKKSWKSINNLKKILD